MTTMCKILYPVRVEDSKMPGREPHAVLSKNGDPFCRADDWPTAVTIAKALNNERSARWIDSLKAIESLADTDDSASERELRFRLGAIKEIAERARGE